METTTDMTTIREDLKKRIRDLVNRGVLTQNDQTSVLRLVERMIERRRAEP